VSSPLRLIQPFNAATVSYHKNPARQSQVLGFLASEYVHAYLANGILVVVISHLFITDTIRRTRDRSVRFGFLRRGATVVVRAGWRGSLGERGCGPVVFPPGLVLFLQLDTPVDDIGSGALEFVTVRYW